MFLVVVFVCACAGAATQPEDGVDLPAPQLAQPFFFPNATQCGCRAVDNFFDKVESASDLFIVENVQYPKVKQKKKKKRERFFFFFLFVFFVFSLIWYHEHERFSFTLPTRESAAKSFLQALARMNILLTLRESFEDALARLNGLFLFCSLWPCHAFESFLLYVMIVLCLVLFIRLPFRIFWFHSFVLAGYESQQVQNCCNDSPGAVGRTSPSRWSGAVREQTAWKRPIFAFWCPLHYHVLSVGRVHRSLRNPNRNVFAGPRDVATSLCCRK